MKNEVGREEAGVGEVRENAFRMAVEMECFRTGQWAPRRPMASEGNTPFAPEEPESLAVGLHRLRSEESSLAVSDRAVGPSLVSNTRPHNGG